MPIKVCLDQILAKRNVTSKALAEHVGITTANMSLLKQGKVKGFALPHWKVFVSFWSVSQGIF